MAPALVETAATTGAATTSSTGLPPEIAPLILIRINKPKYPPRMAAATKLVLICLYCCLFSV